jgi:hypothetical protein
VPAPWSVALTAVRYLAVFLKDYFVFNPEMEDNIHSHPRKLFMILASLNAREKLAIRL